MNRCVFSSEPIGEALVRGIFAGLCSVKRREIIAKMRAQYEQGTL